MPLVIAGGHSDLERATMRGVAWNIFESAGHGFSSVSIGTAQQSRAKEAPLQTPTEPVESYRGEARAFQDALL